MTMNIVLMKYTAPGKSLMVALYTSVYNGLDNRGKIDSHEASMEKTLPNSPSGTALLIMDLVTTIGTLPMHETTEAVK